MFWHKAVVRRHLPPPATCGCHSLPPCLSLFTSCPSLCLCPSLYRSVSVSFCARSNVINSSTRLFRRDFTYFASTPQTKRVWGRAPIPRGAFMHVWLVCMCVCVCIYVYVCELLSCVISAKKRCQMPQASKVPLVARPLDVLLNPFNYIFLF